MGFICVYACVYACVYTQVHHLVGSLRKEKTFTEKLSRRSNIIP